jgi:hypothetical protein
MNGKRATESRLRVTFREGAFNRRHRDATLRLFLPSSSYFSFLFLVRGKTSRERNNKKKQPTTPLRNALVPSIISESHDDEKALEKREPESVTAMLMRKKEERKSAIYFLLKRLPTLSFFLVFFCFDHSTPFTFIFRGGGRKKHTTGKKKTPPQFKHEKKEKRCRDRRQRTLIRRIWVFRTGTH